MQRCTGDNRHDSGGTDDRAKAMMDSLTNSFDGVELWYLRAVSGSTLQERASATLMERSVYASPPCRCHTCFLTLSFLFFKAHFPRWEYPIHLFVVSVLLTYAIRQVAEQVEIRPSGVDVQKGSSHPPEMRRNMYANLITACLQHVTIFNSICCTSE